MLRKSFTVVFVTVASAVNAVSQTVVPVTGFTPVYVERFRSSDGPRSDDFAQFTAAYLRYALSSSAQLKPQAVERAEPCVTNARSRKESLSASTAPDAATLRGTVQSVGDTSALLDVEVTLCRRGSSELVLHDVHLVKMRGATDDLEALSSRVGDRLRLKLLPSVRIGLEGFESLTAGAGKAPLLDQVRTLGDRVAASVVQRGAANPISEGIADFALTLVPSGASSSLSRVRVRIRGGPSDGPPLVDSIDVTRDKLSTDAFFNRVAEAAAQRLAEDVHAPRLRAATSDASFRDSAVVVARASLCLDRTSSCRVNLDAASSALDALGPALNDPDIVVLRARLALAGGNFGEAVVSLRRADSLVAVGRQASVPEASLMSIGLALASAFRGAGNYSEAVKELQRLRAQQPGDSAITALLVQSLRLSGLRWSALEVGSEFLRTRGKSTTVRIETAATARDLGVRAVLDSTAKFKYLCKADSTLARDCGAAIGAAAEDATSSGRTSPLRELLPLARDLGLFSLQDSVAAVGAIGLAIGALGPLRVIDSAGVPSSVSGGAIDSVPSLLAFAASSIVAGSSEALSAKLSRARAAYRTRVGDLTTAVNDLRRAFEVTHDRSDALQAVTLSRLAIERARAGVGADTTSAADTKAILDTAVRLFPGDDELLSARARFCGDYAFDLACAFQSDSARETRGFATDPEDILDGVESAILTGHDRLAAQWLARIHGSLSACDSLVAAFYAYWTEQPSLKADAFDNWAAALQSYRSRRADVCWIFEGAKHFLKSGAVPDAGRLLAMIAAYESASAPVPRRP